MLTTARVVPVVLLALCTRTLAAQTLGLPMPVHPVMRGFAAAFDVAVDDSGVGSYAVTAVTTLGHVTSVNTRADGTVDSMGMPLFNVSATVTSLGGRTQQGKAFGVELTLVSFFAVGVNRANWRGTKLLHVPLSVTVPGMVCGNRRKVIALYVVPVWNFERIDGPASWQPSWSAFGVQLLLEFRSGLGFQLAAGDPSDDSAADPYRRSVISLGIHWSPHSIVKNGGASVPAGKMQCDFLF